MRCITKPKIGEFYLTDSGNIIKVISKDLKRKTNECERYDIYVQFINGNKKGLAYFVGEDENYFTYSKQCFSCFTHLKGYNTKLWKILNK